MEFRPIDRSPDAFQRPVPEERIEAMCWRAFGSGTHVVSAVELGNGSYNTTYRVDIRHRNAESIGQERPVILRVAPEPCRQYRIERELMRNEHASTPYLAPIASMLPRTLVADFTHDIIDRDYLFQTILDGTPAPDCLGRYPRTAWTPFFRQLGDIAGRIHAVRGERFGPVTGPQFDSWADALIAYFTDLAADLDDAGLDSSDVRAVAVAAGKHRAVLDEITEPRLLHGDLWTVNLMMDPGAAEPTISGVFDNDRTSWGDPEADWAICMAASKPGTERDAFWETYGPRPATDAAGIRSQFYLARHIGAIRLERHRLSKTDAVPQTYQQMREVLDRLGS